MEHPKSHLFKRIILQAREYWLHIFVIFFIGILATPLALLKPLALKLVIDNGFGSQPMPGYITMFFPDGFEFSFNTIVLVAAALVILVALIENIVNVINWVLETYTGEKLVLNFRTILFNHIQRLSLAYHDTKGTSDSLYRLQWDTMGIRSFLIGNMSPLISSLITLLSMIFVMFLINWHFAVVALCLIPPLFFLTRMSTKRLKKDWNKVKNDESLAMSVVHEVLGSLRVVKAFGQEDYEGERFISQSNKALRGQIKMAWIGAGFYFVVGMLFATGTAFFIYLGANDVHSGKMTLGELTLVIAYLSQIFGPLQNISKKLNEVQSSITSIQRVFALLDHEKEVKETLNSVHLSKVKGAFAFENVSFCYVNNKPILRNISFDIFAGDRVGIMGSTGAGKTSLISLLMRFYDPTAGTILLDGTDIKMYKLAEYRNQFSIVLQDTVLFSTSIYENISYGRPEATEKEIIEAAKAANAHEFIISCNEGYNTLVGERGMQLSGGERQRISLARAFIKNAPLLILDEPTSSLDIKTESLIMQAMERLMVGRTTFMITHRLDTLHNCNLILHLEKGVLVDIVRDFDKGLLIEKKNFLMNEFK